jgi:hypothetical protein
MTEKSTSSEGRSPETAQWRFHKRSDLSRMTVQCCNGEEEKWKVADVYGLHIPQHILPEG